MKQKKEKLAQPARPSNCYKIVSLWGLRLPEIEPENPNKSNHRREFHTSWQKLISTTLEQIFTLRWLSPHCLHFFWNSFKEAVRISCSLLESHPFQRQTINVKRVLNWLLFGPIFSPGLLIFYFLSYASYCSIRKVISFSVRFTLRGFWAWDDSVELSNAWEVGQQPLGNAGEYIDSHQARLFSLSLGSYFRSRWMKHNFYVTVYPC